ncbi:MAG: eukaryotic-like serine/threonine-protein kinase [Actinomycetota bacterium]|nr:eukaryotic-like serine/threonine-protein kinase [Actinomycetota bacterium]
MTQARRLGDRYELGDELGRGGMAEVVEAQDLRLGRRVAIKLLRPDLARDPSFQARFRREAQSAAALNHPNIVAVYDTGEDQLTDGAESVTVPFIVMEYVDGVTLRQLLSSGRRLLPERALEITAGILAALDYSHRHGIVHRDIKPANVMLTRGGEVKVMDFGIARAIADSTSTMTAASTVMGTAQYLSPEQARGEVVDARSDLYSTGCVLYELLTNRPPFIGESPVSVAYQHVGEAPVPPSSIDPSVPVTLDAIVMKALEKNREQRYQSAAEFRSDVERAIAGMPVTAAQGMNPVVAAAPAATAIVAPLGATSQFPAAGSPAEVVTTEEEEKKRSAWMWIAIVLIVLLVGIGAVFAGKLLGSNSSKPQVAVPSIVGMTTDEASLTLSKSGLKLGKESTQVSDKAPNTIISQDPLAGVQLEQGQGVAVVISAGKQKVAVPNLIGVTSVEDARSSLADAKLNLGSVSEVDSDQPNGSVLKQSPSAGTNVDAGSRVDITVSNGKVKVPGVVGKSEAQAKSDLTNAGFQVNVTTQEDSGQPGIVLAQSPQAGTTAVKGTLVTITVSVQGPTPTPTPTTPSPTLTTDSPTATVSGAAQESLPAPVGGDAGAIGTPAASAS